MQSLKNQVLNQFDRVVVIHNVGTMGCVNQYTNDLTDINVWHNYYDLNVFIPAILNGVIMQIFNENTNTEKLVINITSLFGIQPGKCLAYYCSGKAAREMIFKVIFYISINDLCNFYSIFFKFMYCAGVCIRKSRNQRLKLFTRTS